MSPLTLISLVIPTVCYVVASGSLYSEGKHALSWAFFGYAFANLGLIAAAR